MDQFSRTRMLLGGDAMDVLAHSRVAVFGLGGVGGYVVEALARSGIGALDLIDSDVISPTNLNRQIFALHDTLGQNKTDAALARVRSIHPACRVTLHNVFFLPETADRFDFSLYDYVVDAVDTVTAKLLLVQRAQSAGTPVISAMGAGNKLDPCAFEVADIYKTSVCPLARIMRVECRKRGIRKLKVVYSKEPPRVPVENSGEETTRRSLPGSVAFVPSVMGLILASEVIKDLTAVKHH